MDLLLVALVLGVVEGLTEFLPVSSTGHLILAGHALGFKGDAADTFEVAIQSGAMLAVVVLYWRRFWGLVRPPQDSGFAGVRGIGLIALTSLPAFVMGALLHGFIKRNLFNPTTVALGLAVGAVAIFVVEALPLKVRTHSLDELDWRQALGVGLCQCLALWPGMSRSACTILGGMGVGLSRAAAAEFSFFAAVPIICAATALDLYKGIKGGLLSAADLPHFSVGLVVSFVSAWLAIKGFIRLVQTTTLRPFALYRIVIAAVVLLSPSAFG
ncbi:MAG: undecaprenyl-diphosphate phosphatase [Myxococcota bacterium]